MLECLDGFENHSQLTMVFGFVKVVFIFNELVFIASICVLTYTSSYTAHDLIATKLYISKNKSMKRLTHTKKNTGE